MREFDDLPAAPYDFISAVAASREASEKQKEAEDWLGEKATEFADAERNYRRALALKIVALKAEGMAVTAAGDVARGDDEVVELKYTRDLAEGLKEAAAQAIWRHTADRRDMEQFLDWSKRASFLDAPTREPAGMRR